MFKIAVFIVLVLAFSGCEKPLEEASKKAWFYEGLAQNFLIGFGGGTSFEFQDDANQSIWLSAVDLMLDNNISSNSSYQSIKNFDAAQFNLLEQHLKRADFFAIWITKGWQESWFDVDAINKAIDAGKIPVFIYWYFGDSLVDAMPTSSEIDTYLADANRLKLFLDKVKGHKLLIMEPEFNKQSVLDDPATFIAFMSSAIGILDNESTAISLCMTDTGNRGTTQTYSKCGYSNCALGDRYEWGLSEVIYDGLIDQLDFISFQEMLGQFSRNPNNPGSFNAPIPIAYSDAEIGINELPNRLNNMALFLYERYGKPVFLPYMTIATATWTDSNGDANITNDEINATGYEAKAAYVYRTIDTQALQNNHLFGLGVMELFDEPDHDAGGYQYFMQNEYHLGIIKSSAKAGVDGAINGDIVFKSDILDSLF